MGGVAVDRRNFRQRPEIEHHAGQAFAGLVHSRQVDSVEIDRGAVAGRAGLGRETRRKQPGVAARLRRRYRADTGRRDARSAIAIEHADELQRALGDDGEIGGIDGGRRKAEGEPDKTSDAGGN